MSDYYYEEDEGIHFDPKDEELINDYLIPKSRGEACGDFIVHKNVYAKEPWLLDHNKKDRFFMENEWYYFVKRTQVSEKNIGCGKNAKRKITGDNDGIDRGNWKADSSEPIIDEETRKIIGIKQTLTFKKSNSNKKKKQKIGDGTSVTVPGSESSWIMKEYMLPEGDKFQELVLCKIHEIKKSKNKDDHHEASTSTYHHESSSSSEQQPISDHDSVLASSSSSEQLLLCGGYAPEIPRIASTSSLTCSDAETERNIEQSGEGNFVHQIDALSLIETVPERSSEKDKAMEVTQEVEEEDWIGDFMDKYTAKGLEGVLMIADQQQRQQPISSATAHMNVPLARLGDKSLPIELDENSEEDEDWNQELDAAYLALT